jgi:hypothetical protein
MKNELEEVSNEFKNLFNRTLDNEVIELIYSALEEDKTLTLKEGKWELECTCKKIGTLQNILYLNIYNLEERKESIYLSFENGINNGTVLKDFKIYERDLTKREKWLIDNENKIQVLKDILKPVSLEFLKINNKKLNEDVFEMVLLGIDEEQVETLIINEFEMTSEWTQTGESDFDVLVRINNNLYPKESIDLYFGMENFKIKEFKDYEIWERPLTKKELYFQKNEYLKGIRKKINNHNYEDIGIVF